MIFISRKLAEEESKNKDLMRELELLKGEVHDLKFKLDSSGGKHSLFHIHAVEALFAC